MDFFMGKKWLSDHFFHQEITNDPAKERSYLHQKFGSNFFLSSSTINSGFLNCKRIYKPILEVLPQQCQHFGCFSEQVRWHQQETVKVNRILRGKLCMMPLVFWFPMGMVRETWLVLAAGSSKEDTWIEMMRETVDAAPPMKQVLQWNSCKK